MDFNTLRTIVDPARTPDDFTPELPEDFPPIDLEARRRARIDARIEEAMRAHPSNRGGLRVIQGGNDA